MPGVAFEVLRADPDVGGDSVRFVQTFGGRAGFPAPRRVKQKPFVRIHSATAWTTLALTIRADGRSEHELVGASKFPPALDLRLRRAARAQVRHRGFQGVVPRGARRPHPWGDEESQAFVAQAEPALERQISRSLMQAEAKPTRRVVESGAALVEQGEPGTDLYLLLDGVFGVEIDGDEVAEIGPGAIVGERALLEGGERTATLRAKTRCRVAVVSPEALDRGSLERLAASRAVT